MKKMNLPRTVLLKVASLLMIATWLNVLAHLSTKESEWYTGTIVVFGAVFIIIALVLLLFGRITETDIDDDDIIDH
jgi:hypothetical protein